MHDERYVLMTFLFVKCYIHDLSLILPLRFVICKICSLDDDMVIFFVEVLMCVFFIS